MIKKKGTFQIAEGIPNTAELVSAIETLKDGEYDYYIVDSGKNRALPQLKYLNGIVLKTISDNLPGNPPIGALYRFFEKEYAPIHYCNINGQRFVYRDLKAEPSTEMNDVIEAIVHHAHNIFGIEIPTIDDLKSIEAKELYVGAYSDAWKDYLTNSHQDS